MKLITQLLAPNPFVSLNVESILNTTVPHCGDAECVGHTREDFLFNIKYSLFGWYPLTTAQKQNGLEKMQSEDTNNETDRSFSYLTLEHSTLIYLVPLYCLVLIFLSMISWLSTSIFTILGCCEVSHFAVWWKLGHQWGLRFSPLRAYTCTLAVPGQSKHPAPWQFSLKIPL